MVDSQDVATHKEKGESSTQKRKRGPTEMKEITRAKSEGQKLVIQYNELGQEIGQNATKLKSFIGTIVWFHVPVIYSDWPTVPKEIKDKIFELIEAGFVVDPRSKKTIIQNAGVCFRQFKYRLTTTYVLPFLDDVEKLKFSPNEYSFIDQQHWTEFVASRYLYTRMESSRTLNLYKFVDAGSISCGSCKEERAQLLTARLLGTDYDQLLLIPYNSGNHWTLVVINLTKGAAFWIDPLKNRIDPDVTEVVERSFNIMNKKKPNWKVVKCNYYCLAVRTRQVDLQVEDEARARANWRATRSETEEGHRDYRFRSFLISDFSI
ncbi:uncharacterized protein E6C27_scaffold1250G00110 [Cucumis melo var. makuwa]|uniref:Ubiquitin-like protease family profile domain-containing protein n=1 Tax=Cucumis melo var. makuwa TaxID=1194695 RepID=A0A5A7U5S2_CUCMM|nr:uncharacterized protein E6C27_scaffold1250G00110 [Cucumis melo var. makuwa]